jgi:hypothetical protein
MTHEKTTAKGKQKPPFRGVAFRSLHGKDSIRFTDNEFIDAVFSGGYYIVLMNGDVQPDIFSKTKLQTLKNRKNEEVLRLANQVKEIIGRSVEGNVRASANTENHINFRPNLTDTSDSLRERLLADLQTLIHTSNYNNTEFDRHLAHELDIARKHVLNGGAIDDYALMQTMQEIASIQGLSVVGTAMRGRFASDIMNEPDLSSFTAVPQPNISADDSTLGSTVFNNDIAEFQHGDLREYDQFSAYSIRELGVSKHHPSFFFAKKLMTSLLNAEPLKEQEQSSAEVTP